VSCAKLTIRHKWCFVENVIDNVVAEILRRTGSRTWWGKITTDSKPLH